MTEFSFEELRKQLGASAEEVGQERTAADAENREQFAQCNTIQELADLILSEKGPIPHDIFANGPLQTELTFAQRTEIVRRIYAAALSYIQNPTTGTEAVAELNSLGDGPLRERVQELLIALFTNPAALVEAKNWVGDNTEAQAVLDARIKEIENSALGATE